MVYHAQGLFRAVKIDDTTIGALRILVRGGPEHFKGLLLEFSQENGALKVADSVFFGSLRQLDPLCGVSGYPFLANLDDLAPYKVTEGNSKTPPQYRIPIGMLDLPPPKVQGIQAISEQAKEILPAELERLIENGPQTYIKNRLLKEFRGYPDHLRNLALHANSFYISYVPIRFSATAI